MLVFAQAQSILIIYGLRRIVILDIILIDTDLSIGHVARFSDSVKDQYSLDILIIKSFL